MTIIIDGNKIAKSLRASLQECVRELEDQGVTPGLATVLMSDDPASETYVRMKQQDCDEIGINGIDIELDPSGTADDLFETINELNRDPAVHGFLVQMPLPDHINEQEVIETIAPEKDVDGFHPENVGNLVLGHPRFKPCTPHGIQFLLDSIDVDPEGKDTVIVGRSNIVGKPLANLLLQKTAGGNATVTVCHSRTKNLAAKTKKADIVVAACGVPELIDGSMLSDGVVVIDVGVNRRDADTEKGYELVGDVEFASAKEKASAITPVPGGVGPMTRAMLLYNTIKAASAQTDASVTLP